jgi:hypothetical protein
MEAASLLRKVENNSGTAGAVERFMIELCVADEVWPLYSLLTVIFERAVAHGLTNDLHGRCNNRNPKVRSKERTAKIISAGGLPRKMTEV